MTSGNSPLIFHPLPATARTPARHDIKGFWRLCDFVFWRLGMCATLTKFPIAVLSTLSTATGYVVFCRSVNSGVVTASLGVLLLAMGASAMNQFQDREFDARMERTRLRPIPSGVLRPAAAFTIAALLVIAGFLLLWRLHNLTAALLGLFAVVWYNGVYTYLKRISAFAVVPGALIGALPPIIGWAAGGGSPLDPKVFALAFFFFIWQVPHFWLLLFRFGEDYQRAGLPSLTKIFGPRQLASLTFIWMLATSASSLLLPIYLLTSSPWVTLGLITTGFWLAWRASALMRGSSGVRTFLPVFHSINLYALLIMLLLVADALI